MNESLQRAAREVREQCICTKLRQASRAVTQHYDAVMAGSGVRATQIVLLVALAQAPEVPLSKLAEVLVMDRTTLTRNLAPLIRDGLAKEHAMADARVKTFALTARGAKVLEEALPAWKKAQNQILRALDPKDVDALGRLLDVLIGTTRPA
jgi:DNA-binding MarR family transcriptional regulator